MRLLITVMSLLLIGGEAVAADSDGNFAIKGAGVATCANYLAAKVKGGREYFMYAGWAEGYLSAANLYEPATFDIAPWQNTDVIASALATYCENSSDEKFHLALTRLMSRFYPTRLQERSPLLALGSDERGVAIYAEVLARAKRRLAELGYLGGTGQTGQDLDPETREAFAKFQRNNDLMVTSLPDQVTLLHLFTAADRSREKAP